MLARAWKADRASRDPGPCRFEGERRNSKPVRIALDQRDDRMTENIFRHRSNGIAGDPQGFVLDAPPPRQAGLGSSAAVFTFEKPFIRRHALLEASVRIEDGRIAEIISVEISSK